MTSDANSWKTAHDAPAAKELAGRERSTSEIWTLRYGIHTARAEVIPIRDVGYDLRYTIDDQLHSTDLYRDTCGTRATLAALAKKRELIAKGWREPA